MSFISRLSSLFFAFTIAMTSQDASKSGQLSYHGDGTDLNKVYNTLITSPDITSLDLSFGYHGCVIKDYRWSFDFQPGDRFPDLLELRLSRYDLLNTRWHWRARDEARKQSWTYFMQKTIGRVVPSLAPDMLQEAVEPNIDQWLRAMDWSKLHTFHLEQEEEAFYTLMEDKLPSIRHLSLVWHYQGNIVPQNRLDFLSTIPPLTSLSIIIGHPCHHAGTAPFPTNRTAFPLTTILSHHGATLQNLSLHQTESHNPHLRRTMFTIEDLTSIKTTCPNLTHLGLDIDRDAPPIGWPNQTLNTILSIPSLTSLTLGLEMGADLHAQDRGEYTFNRQGLHSGGPFREPRMAHKVAEQMFAEFREKKVGRELRRVEFVVGDYRETGFLGPLYRPYWEEGRARKFVCDVDAAEGEKRKGEERWCKIFGGHEPYADDDVVGWEGRFEGMNWVDDEDEDYQLRLLQREMAME